jgi:hypothetical protein
MSGASAFSRCGPTHSLTGFILSTHTKPSMNILVATSIGGMLETLPAPRISATPPLGSFSP